ncbi:hypothetical protein B0T26DRAFT_670925 [Lasiosphaeria miniovina]|uniref:Secreted protein n=1 Tax=Lasiosphaeria miniovina TaxID=1954250 RepID=A0AA40EDT0_9PEZI|nr:uncharacterized protein B0T26DRAFT_670925 [Lasiosphaeria miniovina]KAK0734662.1 hypothetical protein B0T26DRAFT_670925 [Lasiosphaeria miniovina]
MPPSWIAIMPVAGLFPWLSSGSAPAQVLSVWPNLVAEAQRWWCSSGSWAVIGKATASGERNGAVGAVAAARNASRVRRQSASPTVPRGPAARQPAWLSDFAPKPSGSSTAPSSIAGKASRIDRD